MKVEQLIEYLKVVVKNHGNLDVKVAIERNNGFTVNDIDEASIMGNGKEKSVWLEV